MYRQKICLPSVQNKSQSEFRSRARKVSGFESVLAASEKVLQVLKIVLINSKFNVVYDRINCFDVLCH